MAYFTRVDMPFQKIYGLPWFALGRIFRWCGEKNLHIYYILYNLPNIYAFYAKLKNTYVWIFFNF